MFDPASIKPSQLNDLRHAAEQAWADDTRSEQFIGHPQHAAGQCFVTAQWLTHKLGGHVGTKRGHFFWVSPDKSHVIDLTGDLFAYEPADQAPLQDEEDEPWELDPHQRTHRAGPVMYKRGDHPIYKGFRVLPDYPDHARAKLFERRANAALRGERTASYHQADLMGPSCYPGETPQYEEDHPDINSITLHDEPDYNPESDLTTHEYRFVVANGQLHLSPIHSHSDLASHAGYDTNSTGPFAAGYAEVNRGHVLWSVDSNIALRGLKDILSDYTDTVGWKWDGMVGSDGVAIGDDFGPKQTMYYKTRNDGHLVLSHRPLPSGQRIRIEGKTAHVPSPGIRDAAIQEWARDYGYKLAEYPGGGNMLDRMKNKETLDVFNRGDTDFQPERSNPDLELPGPVTCGTCGQVFKSEAELRVHHLDHENTNGEIEDGHFPAIEDFDVPLGFGRNPIPNSNSGEGSTTARTAVMVLPNHKEAARHPRFDLYAKLFNYDHDEGLQFYGAYRHGQLVAYGAVRLATPEPEVLMIDALEPGSGLGTAILSLMQKHFDHFYTHADSEAGERLMRRHGMANVKGRLWRWAKGQEPKDMIEEAIPIIYDHRKHQIEIGYAGQKTQDIPGKFTPGGIIEGYYEPGGKIVLIGSMPGSSVYSFASLWYHHFPQMEITSVETEGPDGKTHKLAAGNVGQFVRTIAASDQAAAAAYQALKAAGGKVYAVGGVVRDALQGRDCRDVDLMVAGLPPEQVTHILGQLPGRVDLTGKRFGVYRYKVNGQDVEIALPRQDKYETARRGEGVITVDHNLPVEQDLLRRDFTANSMAVDLDTGELIDPHGGAKDIEQNILRTTHPDSFTEDPTRLVRALAAHGRFGLNPDERTRAEMVSNGHLLSHESPDALNKVIDKTLVSHNPAGAFRLGHETGILKHLFPEVDDNWDFDQNNPHHRYPLGDHLMNVLDGVSQQTTDPDVRMAGLLHDIGKPASAWTDPVTGYSHYYEGQGGQGADHETVGAHMAEARMRKLNYPVARINRVRHLIQHHMFPAFSSSKGARKFLQNVGDQHADDLLTLRQADMAGKGQTAEEIAERTQVERQRELVDQARKSQAPTDLSNLAINGNDLIGMGLKPGPAVGQVLRSLLDDVVQQPTMNQRDQLLQRAQTYINAQPLGN